ncbi:MAG TPA: chromosomal replication initiator protein DnaA [Methylomirabilota bacterium]|nr:chromosomal replication initiator protein DnaA [Methylomirabilota bacterium]
MDTNLTNVWENVLTELKSTVSQGNFVTILKPTLLLSLEDDIATIAAGSPIILNLLQKRFATQIKEALKKQLGKEIDILFIVKNLPTQQKKQTAATPLFEQPESIQKELKPFVGHLPRVRPDFTFPNFAVASTNQLAFVSAQTVADNIGQSYNPLFIYGPVGVGKTHLMHAIANTVYQRTPERKIIYITSEEFTNEVVDAIRNNETAKMKKRFRSAYILLIDDIQFIEGKERVQEELFHTFNILIDNGSQICLTSDRPPQEIKKLEKRLSSRFAGGLTVDIGKPDLELKTAILLKKAEKFGHELPTDVALFLADNAEDTRSLEGLLLRVITQATTSLTGITLELAQLALGNVVQEKRQQLHADDIINYVCSYYNVKHTQLKGPKRDASLVRARQVCMYLLHSELKLTLAEVGNLLGGRDHTTIMHGVEKIEKLVENKEKISEDILGITRSLRG